MSKPRLPNWDLANQLGFNPKTGEYTGKNACYENFLHDNIKKNLRIMDEQQFVHRYKWYGLPHGLTEDIIERILYYRGVGMFFYVEENNKFYFLPFTYSEEIDCYGRWTHATPLPFTGANKVETTNEKNKKISDGFLPGIIRELQYEIQLDNMTYADYLGKGVLCYDYTKQLSQIVIPRAELVDAILDIEADLIPYMKTALMNSTGVVGLRCNSADEQADVALASKAIERAAMNQEKFVPITGKLDFQELSTKNVAQSEEFLVAMQSIDNFRKMLIGLGDGNLFQTKAHMLQSQMDMAIGQVDSIYADGLRNRQNFCNVVNSIWGIGIWCDADESSTQTDSDMDGLTASENDQSGAGESIPEGGTTNVDGE